MPARPPSTRALNQGYQYLTETRYGESEAILDLLRRTAQSMGMPVRSVEIEMGPSQFEFTFAPSDPMTIAEMAVTFRALAKEVCHRQGLLATFMAKPRLANAAANGWHIHQSLIDLKTGEKPFARAREGELSATAGAWVAGLLAHAPAACLLTSPTVNGYKRFAPYQLAPNRIGWGEDNRGAMIRALVGPDAGASRIENRVPDSTANPYFALAAQLVSGLDGLVRGLVPPAALSRPYDGEEAHLPRSLQEAIGHFAGSERFKETLGTEFVDYMTRLKTAEWDRYLAEISEWEQREYFTSL